jgi:CRISPR system Cascade subunit CasC
MRCERAIHERTQRLGDLISAHLKKSGIEDAKALEITRLVAGAFGKIEDAKDKPQTYIKQLAFISPEERIAALEFADKLAAEGADAAKKEELAGKLLRRADTAADIAMFGRMLADNPDYNREAAVQVAHAITTHKVVVEDDFYTAVDDLKKPAEDAGAGFIGELGFGSGVFYLYACIDRELLVKNLGGNTSLAKKAIEAFVEGFTTARPNGKQNSFAAHARANYLRVEKGGEQPRSLAAAFFKPIWGEDLLNSSVAVLEGKEGLIEQMNAVYGPCYEDAHEMRCLPGKPYEGTLAQAIKFARE